MVSCLLSFPHNERERTYGPQSLIAPNSPLLFILLESHRLHILPYAHHNACPCLLISIQHLRELLAQLEAIWVLIPYEVDRAIDVLVALTLEFEAVKVSS